MNSNDGIKFEIDGQQYQTKAGWHDVPFQMFMNYLGEVAPEEPEVLKDFVASHIEFIEELDQELSEEAKQNFAVNNWEASWDKLGKKKQLKCYQFFALDIGFWVGLDSATIKQSLNKDQLAQAFWANQIVLNIGEAKPDPEFTGFKIGNKEYLLPQKHMEGSTVAEFADAAHFEEQVGELMQDRWEAILDLMVVICRPKDEKYDFKEQAHKQRKNFFRKLNMDVLINVAFFLLRLNDTLRDNLLIYSLQQQVQQAEAEKLQKAMDGLY